MPSGPSAQASGKNRRDEAARDSAPAAASDSTALERIDAACRNTLAGKLAAKELAAWVEDFAVGECEFRLLWILFRSLAAGVRSEAETAHDQVQLARLLGASPAQVSGAVERLRGRGLIAPSRDDDDRRRRLWHMTAAGSELIAAVMHKVAAYGAADRCACMPIACGRCVTKEAA